MSFLVIKMPKSLHYAGFEGGNRYFEFSYPRHALDDKSNGTGENVYRHSLYMATTEADAQELAQKVSQENPGYEVYVATAGMVMQSAIPEVIQKRITKEGILPA